MNLFHYCSNETFVSIIKNRSLHLSLVSLSNDYLEGKWFHRVFQKVAGEAISNPALRDGLIKLMDWYLSVVAAAAFCLSEEADQLSQWRAYADEARGVSIGFRPIILEKLTDSKDNKCILQKIDYDALSQEKQVRFVLQGLMNKWPSTDDGYSNWAAASGAPHRRDLVDPLNLDEIADFLISLVPTLYKLKNPAFAEEREWRLIVPVIIGAVQTQMSNLLSCEYRAAGDRIIPFVRVPFGESDDFVQEVVLGPRNRTPLDVFRALLEVNNLFDVKIRVSRASYQ